MAISHCRLSKSTQLRLLEYYVLEVTVRSAANLLGIHANSAILFYRKVRQGITEKLAIEAQEIFNGDIEIDESYFGGVRKFKRGRGAAGRVVVFGMLKRHGKVYAVIGENTKEATLMTVIANKIKPDSVVYTDTYRSYDALDVSEFHHHRINHSEVFVHQKNHINGIEIFWNQAKRALRKYNGIDKKLFLQF